MKSNILLRVSIFLFCLILFLTVSSCKKSIPVEPEDISVPGKRDYTWTIDTLYMPMNNIHSIWGSSPEDVWVCGPGGDGPEWVQHYDGSKWTPYTKNGGVFIGGSTLFGFSKDNAWIGGEGGRIWHYDGNNWKGNYIYEVEGSYDRTVQDIWGTSPDDMYACGLVVETVPVFDTFKGFILHYDGQSWKEVARADFQSQFLAIRKAENHVYVFSYTINRNHDDSSAVEFYELKGNQLSKIYSNVLCNITWASMFTMKDKIYFTIQNDLFRFDNGKAVKVLSNTDSNFGFQFFGRSERDLFIRMKDGLAHYNGTDIQYVFKYPNSTMRTMNQPLMFEKDVFISLWDPYHNKNMVLHGRLKE